MDPDFADMEMAVAAPAPAVYTPEMPEIKLFGKWSLEEVQLNDMSLQVCSKCVFLLIIYKHLFSYFFIIVLQNKVY